MAASTAALRGITKQYKDFTLGPVDMTVPAGSIVGLIGENGAGKTTLLKILCGVNRADDGTVDLLGGSPADAATRAKIGVVFEDAFFLRELHRRAGRAQSGRNVRCAVECGQLFRPSAPLWSGRRQKAQRVQPRHAVKTEPGCGAGP